MKAYRSRTFLCLDEAREHQNNLRDGNDNYSERYGRGVYKVMVELEDKSLVSGWESRWEEYRG